MQLQGKALRVTVYIGESDRYQSQALYRAILEFLKREGASGATVIRGLAGFGARSRIHTATILTLSEDLPLRLEWIDQHEVVERLLPEIRGMVDDGLITVEELSVVQYAPGRRPDPLAQPVGDIMRTEVTTVTPDTPVADVVTLLLRRGYRSLPVVNGEGRLLGIITDGDLLRDAGLLARLDLQAMLSEEQVQTQVEQLRDSDQQAADVMTQPVVTMRAGDVVRRAMSVMVEKGLKRLPVVDADGVLVGWVSRVDVLRTLEYQHLPEKPPAQRGPEGGTVAELMYRDVPAIPPQATLEEIIQVLEQGHFRRAVVIDDEKRVVGIITDGDLLRRSRRGRHPRLVERLRGLVTGQRPRTPVKLPDSSEAAADLMSQPVITITRETPLVEALQLMLENQIKRLPVVDDEGRLVGLLGRGNLLRGLLADGG